MATTTTNFGWDIPQSTDLVKDGATAIATLGQDIDTALVDLKGGTTGQVLSKNSNTDLDFAWVAQDDSNAIQNTIVDAKGDIITATAADTPARLAVGTNGHYLQADSTTATGLKWAAVSAPSQSFELITTLTLAGNASYTATGLDSYNQIYCALFGVSCDANEVITYRFNSDSNNNYAYQNTDMYQNGNSYSTANVFMSNSSSTGTSNQYIGSQGATDSQYTEGYIHYFGTKGSGVKVGFQWFSYNGGTHSNYVGSVQYLGSSAISSMTFTSTGALDSGTIKIYGSAA